MTFAVSILVKATVVMVLGLFAAWLARRNRAAVRHSILATAFGVVFVLPVVSITLPAIRIPALEASERRAVLTPAPAIVVDDVAPVMAPEVAHTMKGPDVSFNLADLLPVVWIVGAAVYLVPMIAGLWQIRSLRQSGVPWHVGRSLAECIATAAGVYRRLDLVLHSGLSGPATCGVARPLIVLPRDAESWRGEDLHRTLVHEIEHIRRCDSVVGFLARLTCVIYWFHPLMWVASRRLLLEAERACDDAVLRESEAADYADQLVTLAKRSSLLRRSSLFAMASRADLATRIRAVLDNGQRRGPADGRSIAAACTFAAILAAVIAPAILVAQTQPRPKFEVASVKPIDRAQMSRDHEGRRMDSEVFIDRTDLLNYIVQAYLPGSFCVMKVALGYDCPLISIERTVPGWVRNERFEIQAKLPPNSPNYSERQKRAGKTAEVNLMLQVLLEERFHLKMHFEDREIPVYVVTVGKDGHKLKPTPEGGSLRKIADGSLIEMHGMVSSLRNAGRGQIVFQSSSLPEAVDGLANYFDRPLLDRTGLQGDYDFTLDYEAETIQVERPVVDKTSGLGGNFANPFSGLSPGALSAALQDVGLKLESTKARVEILVIDGVDRPTEN